MPEINLKSQLKNILQRHIGRDTAITSEKLSERTGAPDRIVRKTIEELIDQDNMSICSVTEPPAGFFLAASREEAERYTKSLRKRAILIFLRRKKVIRNAGLLRPLEQGRLL